MNNENKKRLFFGIEMISPWPDDFPKGRILDEESRHITMAFLGNVVYEERLHNIPMPGWKVGRVGFFEKCIALARVIAWDPVFFDDRVTLYQKELVRWLKMDDPRGFFPHMTIAREPFDKRGWMEAFTPLPFFAGSLHLYESLGSSKYKVLWSYNVLPPFVEMEHVADIAFRVYGETAQEIYQNAGVALAFKCPEIGKFLNLKESKENVTEIVIALNDAVAKLDEEVGSPLKAVSFHGEIQEENGILVWEMIIDV